MAHRLNYYFRQKVSESELDAGFAYLEAADFSLVLDHGRTGIISGLGLAEAGVPDLTLDCAAGTAYDKAGQRVRVPSTQSINCALDYALVSTAVVAPGNEKWISIFAKFDRTLTDPRTDGASLTVYFDVAESFNLRVVQGAEALAGAAVKPALDGTNILLADVLLAFGTTAITNAMINTARRERSIVVAGSPRALDRGKVNEALSDLLGYYNNHVTAAADKHAAADVNYAGGGAWSDGTTNPAATVEAQLDKIISDLSPSTGAAKIGAANSGFLTAGTLASQLATLGALKRIIAFGFYDYGSPTTDTSTSSTMANATPNLDLAGAQVGDTVLWFYHFGADSGGVDMTVDMRVIEDQAGTPVNNDFTIYASATDDPKSNGKYAHITSIRGRTVVTAGTVRLQPRFKNSDNATSVALRTRGLYGILLR